ncbi:MAG: hypothetical protein ACOCY5_03980 [Desulfohalobiaceae bacterium]
MLSFRVLYLCIFLPPVLYIFSLQGLEAYLQQAWEQELSQSLIQHRQDLLQGTIRLDHEVQSNIQDFRQSRRATRLGVEFQVLVRTRDGQMLYPVYELRDSSVHSSLALEQMLYKQLQNNLVALENQRLLQQGLNLSLAVQIPRNTWLANLVLLFYIFAFSLVLYFSYQSRVNASQKAAQKQSQELLAARQHLAEERQSLEQAEKRHKAFQQQIAELQNRLKAADSRLRSTEEEAIAELEALEEQLQSADAKRRSKEQEVQELARKLQEMETASQTTDKKLQKQKNVYSKRFQTLYKNLVFQDRALEGFSQLPEEFRLKAEEIIHILNSDPSLISVKRKVFSRSSLTAWESGFAHKGRLYWRKSSSGRVEVLAIGTKNTQAKDLNYLEGLGE